MSNLGQRRIKFGRPLTVVPMFNHRSGFIAERAPPRPLIVDWQSCCQALVELPAMRALADYGATLLIHGQRDDDGRQPLRSPFPHMEVVRPIAAWTVDEVYAFLADRGVELPAQYRAVESSLECPNCPAFATPEVVRYLAREYPETARELVANLTTCPDAVVQEVSRRIDPALAVASGQRHGGSKALIPT